MSSNDGNEPVGLLQKGTIVDVDDSNGTIQVLLNTVSPIKGKQALPVEAQSPFSLFYNNGLFIGTLPVKGTPVVVGQGAGGKYYFVSFLAENLTNNFSPVSFRANKSKIPDLKLGTLLIQSNDDTRITLDVDSNILIGTSVNNIHIDTRSNYISTNFYSEYNFTQASRKINGAVKRDTVFNTQFSQESKLESDDYNLIFKTIGLDPSIPVNSNISGSNKNPPLVESREIIYEFQYSSGVTDDLSESNRYGKSSQASASKFILPNRRLSRSDTLSLSLVSPNYLIETIKGTVVDIFGNLLDLNREILSIGEEQTTLKLEQSTDKVKSFLLIKELERKSLAYHFEINARKDLIGKNGVSPTLPDINSNNDYARTRSRFFLDIDKEGQFKLNVPASSERGNIPLLTRYENYSTFGPEDNKNPNKLFYRNDNRDIFQDSFAAQALDAKDTGFLPPDDKSRGSIKLIGSGSDKKDAAPVDRITEQVIKHGTAYHDILQTCFLHQEPNNGYIQYAGQSYFAVPVSASDIPPLTNIVSNTIIVSGDDAKAGGRSGSFNFDGSIEMNIGANSIDRQSWWLDTAGSVVANIGRDINGRSIIAATGGDFVLQVGGFGVEGDSRFPSKGNDISKTFDNGISGAVLDLRIMTNGGTCHMIRCDDKGITIMSPGNVAIHANGKLELTSNTEIRMDAPVISLHERTVLNAPLGSI